MSDQTKWKGKWIRVNRRHPCKICEHDSWCSRTADGEVFKCMRIASDWVAKGDFGGWYHRVNGDAPRYMPPTMPTPNITRSDLLKVAKGFFLDGRAPTLREELAVQLGVSCGSLKSLCVGWGWDDFRRLSFSSWPQFNERRQIVGIMRRYNVPVADGGGNKLGMRGGSSGLFYAKNWDTIASGSMCVVEGGSDTAALLTIGIPVVGRPSSIGGANMLSVMLEKFKGHIFVIGERDRKPDRPGTQSQCPLDCDGCSWCYPGRYGAKITAAQLLGYLPRHKRRIIWTMPPVGYKDSRSWLLANPEANARDFMTSLSEN